MKSSSVHRITADHSPRFPVAATWYVLNWLNNVWLPNRRDRSLVVRAFQPRITAADWDLLTPTDSPARKLSDLFWMKLPWDAVSYELGSIRILDIGCGSGRYGAQLQRFSKDLIATYVGIDPVEAPTWTEVKNRYPFIELHQRNAEELDPGTLGSCNFIMSQSCIEHVKNDLSLFENIASLANRSRKPLIQVHLFPSSACLKLYLTHGVRHYTPRTVSKITRLFHHNSRCTLVELGGAASNAVHWKYLTRPLLAGNQDQRFVLPDEYDRESRLAIAEDATLAAGQPTFYALVIHSNPTNELVLEVA
jgi:SAM-dependent methyltransferase